MAPRETENNTYAKFGVTNKEHYGMLWYFLEWSILAYESKHDHRLRMNNLGGWKQNCKKNSGLYDSFITGALCFFTFKRFECDTLEPIWIN